MNETVAAEPANEPIWLIGSGPELPVTFRLLSTPRGAPCEVISSARARFRLTRLHHRLRLSAAADLLAELVQPLQVKQEGAGERLLELDHRHRAARSFA